jgi:hypothetical protein
MRYPASATGATGRAHLRLSQARILNFGVGEDDDGILQSHPNEIWVRYSFTPGETWQVIPLSRVANACALSVLPPNHETFALPQTQLSRAKRADLYYLRQFIPIRDLARYPVRQAPSSESGSEGSDQIDAITEEEDDD